MARLANKTIEYSFYLLFGLVPLILTPWNYELFEFNKMILTYLLTTIIIGAWLIKMVASGRIIFRRTPLDLPILLFLVSNFCSTLLSIDRHTSLFGYYSRFNGGLLSIISYVLLYYAFVSNFTNSSTSAGDTSGVSVKEAEMSLGSLRGVLTTILLSGGLVAIYGILEHFGIDEKYWVQDVRHRVFSTLGQPNWLAAYLVGLVPLTWLLSLESRIKNKESRIKKFIIHYSLFIIFYSCLLFTKSRSGLLAFGVSYFVFWTLTLFKLRKEALKPFLVFSSSILILSLLIGLPVSAAEEAEEPALLITPSSEIRKIVWQGAINIWRHHPLLGTGPETFAYAYYWYRPREHNDTSEWDFLYNKAHNEYLNYLACTGIAGLGSYLLLVGWFVIWSLKQVRILNQESGIRKKKIHNSSFIIHNSLLAGYAGLLVSHFFGFSIVITNIFFFLFPAMSFVFASPPQGVNSSQPLRLVHTYTVGIRRIRRWMAIAIILLFTSYCLLLTLRLWYADFLFAKGKNYIKANAALEAFDYFQSAINLNPSEPLFHSELANAASVLSFHLYSQNEATAASQMADFAIKESDTALAISPYHLNYWKTTAKVFFNLGQIDKKYYQNALETLIKASELAPTDAKITYNLGILYYYLGQKNEAIKTMEKTIALKPNYEAAKKKLEEWYND